MVIFSQVSAARPVRRRAWAAAAALALGAALVPSAAEAAPAAVTGDGANVAVSGTSVTATATFAAQPSSSVTYGVCVLSSTNARYDFPFVSGTVTSAGTAYRQTRTLPVGSYWYAPCVGGPGTWNQVGPAAELKVTGVVPVAVPAAMPVGDLPGWKQVVAEDFTSPVALGSWATGSYAKRWFAYSGYADTTGRGWYDPAKVLSVKDGALDWYVHTEGGKPRVGAVVPVIPATGWGQTYGRYSMRFRSDSLENYKMVAMLWPDSDNWGEGEIDFMEVGELDWGNTVYTNFYPRGNTATATPGKPSGFRSNVRADGTGWHVATAEWAPGSVTYWLDGVKLGTTTSSAVPSTRMHLVIQVETAIGLPVPPASAAGHVQVDWIVQYARS
jgi:hypothetical protein